MELTQELGSVPDFPSQQLRSEQIAYLGICGNTHPIKYGRNTIGRHPDSDICIDTASISKLHAVINVLKKDDIKLMDCGSRNKTKLGGVSIKQYQALNLKNGDMVQFGSEMGIFRLCEDDDDELPETQCLPLTQAIPDTPVHTRLHQLENFIIPESPDIEDEHIFRRPSDVSFNKTPNRKHSKKVSIHDLESQLPTYSNSNHNVSKESNVTSEIIKEFPMRRDSDEEIVFEDVDNDFEITESQALFGNDVPETNCIDNEQVVEPKDGTDVHEMLTQIVPSIKTTNAGNEINNKCGIQESKDNHCVSNAINIHDIPTQFVLPENEQNHIERLPPHNETLTSNKIEDIPTQMFDNNDNKMPSNNLDFHNEKYIKNKQGDEICAPIDDILDMPTQIISHKDVFKTPTNKSSIENLPTQVICDISDLPTQAIFNGVSATSSDKQDGMIFENNIHDLPTQIISVDPNLNKANDSSCVNNEDLQTQIVRVKTPEINNVDVDIEDQLTQIVVTRQDRPVVYPNNKKSLTESPEANNVLSKDVDIDIQDQLTQIIVTEQIDLVQLKENSNVKDLLNKNSDITPLHKSDSSEMSLGTPKKRLSRGFVEVELPNTQDIVKSVTSISDEHNEPLSSDSEDDKSKENTPVLFRPKKRVKKDMLLEFTKSNIECLKRVPSRIRKPTPKMQAAMEELGMKNNLSHLSSNSSENEVFSEEIVIGNITRLQSYINKDKENKEDESLKSNNRKRPSKSPKTENKEAKKIKINTDNEGNDSTTKNNSSRNVIDSTTKSLTKQKDGKNEISDKTDIKLTKVTNVSTKSKYTKETSVSTKTITSKKKEKEIKLDIMVNKDGDMTKDQKKTIEIQLRVDEKSTKTCVNQINKESDNNQVNEIETDTLKHKYENRGKKYERSARTKKEEQIKSENKKSLNEINNKNHNNKEKSKTSKSTKSEPSKDNNQDIKHLKKQKDKMVKPEPKNQSKKRKVNNENSVNKTDNNIKVNKDDSMYDDNGLRRSKRIRKTTSEKVFVSILKKSTPNNSYNEESSIEYGSMNGSTKSLNQNKNHSISKANPFKHINDSFSGSSLDLRSSRARITKYPHILYSSFPDNGKKNVLTKMGAITATDVRKCSVLATSNFARTFKILCAIGLGKPIVGEEWYRECVKTESFVEPWDYIVKDEVLEKRYNFNLKKVLLGKRNFLKGYTVTSTPSVAPTKNEMKLIVESSGGTWGESSAGRWLCVTCERDSMLWPGLRKGGAKLVLVELILGGVLTQRLELNKYVII